MYNNIAWYVILHYVTFYYNIINIIWYNMFKYIAMRISIHVYMIVVSYMLCYVCVFSLLLYFIICYSVIYKVYNDSIKVWYIRFSDCA